MPDPQEWYYALNNEQLGPVSTDTLRQMLSSGQLRAVDLIWADGMPQWKPAHELPEFAGIVPAPMLGYATPVTDAGLLTAGGAFRYATFWERVVAEIIDSVVTAIPKFILSGTVTFALQSMNAAPGTRMSVQGFRTLIGYAIPWLYAALMESSPRQATLGKLAMGLIVTDLEGNRISFGRATGRHFGKILSGIICGFGYLMMLWNDRKQCLHDQIASTLVLKRT